MDLDDDLLSQCVQFISSTESRNKVYRLLQYGAKLSRVMVMTMWKIRQEDLREESALAVQKGSAGGLMPSVSITSLPTIGQPQYTTHGSRGTSPARLNVLTPKRKTPLTVEVTPEQPAPRNNARARWVALLLARVEALFGDARKVYRFFQFLEMADLLRHVQDPDPRVRVLRRLRIACFFLFYLLENYMVFLMRIEGFAHRHPRVVLLKRSCNGFWCLSIMLSFPLDYLMRRGGLLSTIKKLLDLPVAYLAFADARVGDGLFSALGLASAEIGVYLRWIDVVAKMRQKRLLQSKCPIPDIA